MALKFSTGLRDKINGLQAEIVGAIIGVSLDFVDGGGSDDSITDSGNGFVTAGFVPGQKIFVQGSTSNDAISGARITTVAAGTIGLPTGTVLVAEVGLAGTVVAIAEGGSLKDIFRDGILEIYSGSQPASPDDAVVGTKLIRVTVASGAWVAGAPENGLEFENDPLDGEIEKNAEVWSGLGLAGGIASWFRLIANPTDTGGISSTLPRMDGSVGISGADINMPNTTITVGNAYTVDSFKLTLPEYYGA
jgi:hypothetical protein